LAAIENLFTIQFCSHEKTLYFSPEQIAVGNLKNGMYLLKIFQRSPFGQNEKGVVIKKIFIEK